MATAPSEIAQTTASAESNGAARVPLRRLLPYAMIEFPVGGAMNASSLFLGFHYASLGVSLTQIGALLMLARLLDVLIDPAVGLLSDRTRNRFGRRKTWIVAGVPIFALATWQLFVPPAEVTALYFGFWLVLFWFGFSMINIPYYAWGAELTPDYHERTRITTWRTIFGTLGGFAFLAIPADSPTIVRCRGHAGQVLSMAAAIALVAVPALVALAVTGRTGPRRRRRSGGVVARLRGDESQRPVPASLGGIHARRTRPRRYRAQCFRSSCSTSWATRPRDPRSC